MSMGHCYNCAVTGLLFQSRCHWSTVSVTLSVVHCNICDVVDPLFHVQCPRATVTVAVLTINWYSSSVNSSLLQLPWQWPGSTCSHALAKCSTGSDLIKPGQRGCKKKSKSSKFNAHNSWCWPDSLLSAVISLEQSLHSVTASVIQALESLLSVTRL